MFYVSLQQWEAIPSVFVTHYKLTICEQFSGQKCILTRRIPHPSDSRCFGGQKRIANDSAQEVIFSAEGASDSVLSVAWTHPCYPYGCRLRFTDWLYHTSRVDAKNS